VKQYRVRLADEAQRDLVDVYRYVATQDSVKSADFLLDELEALCAKLSSCPQRGHVPPELERVAVTAYREVHFKPYRVIYEVIGREVFVHCILDGRRDMQTILERRLLR
jgi:toxin ParE1/3/4